MQYFIISLLSGKALALFINNTVKQNTYEKRMKTEIKLKSKRKLNRYISLGRRRLHTLQTLIHHTANNIYQRKNSNLLRNNPVHKPINAPLEIYDIYDHNNGIKNGCTNYLKEYCWLSSE